MGNYIVKGIKTVIKFSKKMIKTPIKGIKTFIKNFIMGESKELDNQGMYTL